jgi:ribose 5-phosphate isomerase
MNPDLFRHNTAGRVVQIGTGQTAHHLNWKNSMIVKYHFLVLMILSTAFVSLNSLYESELSIPRTNENFSSISFIF